MPARRLHVTLTTMDQVIARLGGPAAVGRLTGRSRSAVANWRGTGRFPARLYLMMTRELQTLGAVALPALWGQHEDDKAA